MKQIAILLLVIGYSASGQLKGVDETPIKTVDRIFNDYIKYSESTDSKGNKEAMKNALQALQTNHETKDLDLLLNVWMYYDPTDFSTGSLIMPIFEKDPHATLKAIDKRIKKKKKWENRETAPYADLFKLRERFL